MFSYSEYYRQRLNSYDKQVRTINLNKSYNIKNNIVGKKRKYEEAMSHINDYEIVQEPKLFITNKGHNWIDAYLENLQPSSSP